jgi:hypothetical protein
LASQAEKLRTENRDLVMQKGILEEVFKAKDEQKIELEKQVTESKKELNSIRGE